MIMSESKYRVFVRNLDPFTSDIDFLSYFYKKYPNAVIGGNIIRDLSGRSKGYGFVSLDDSLSVSRVLSEKNHVINGKKVLCKIASPKKRNLNVPKNFQKREPKHLREIYVGNVNVSTANQQLKEYFQKFGAIVNAYIIFDENKRSKGYGFVEFQSSSSVEQVQEQRPHKINNQEVQTVRTYPKYVPLHLKKPTTVLYVLKYSDDVDEESIEEYFSSYGDIALVSRKIKRPEDTKFMELQFDDYDAVDNICLADNHTINGCNITVAKYIDDNLETSNNIRIRTQNSAKPAATSAYSNNAQTRTQKSVNEKLSTSRSYQPTAPNLPMQNHLPDPPYNPYFVQAQQQQPLYPSLSSTPVTNPQPVPRYSNSSSQQSTSRSRRAEGNDKDCIIL